MPADNRYFSYLTYNFTKQIDQYQAELQSKYIYDNTKYIDITESGQINTFIVTNLNGNSSYNDIYVSLENDYYNISVDSANKMTIELDDYYSSFDTFPIPITWYIITAWVFILIILLSETV